MVRPETFHVARRDRSLAVVEGLHGLKHALRFGGTPQLVVTDQPERLIELAEELAPDLAERLRSEVDLTVLKTAAFEQLAAVIPTTRVLALFGRPQFELAEVLASGDRPIVVLEQPRRMGNVGAAVRAAAAADAAALITIGDRDPWHPDALRGGAGLQFALPVLAAPTLEDFLAARAEASGDGALRRPLAALHGVPEAELLQPGGLRGDEILAFGTERQGLSDELLAAADRHLRLPMREGVASLNLATAVAATLYRG